MKKLQYILSNIQTIATIGNLDIPIQEICIDSRKANQYSLFVAIKGTHLDSHQFIEDVIEKGIVAIVCQQLPNKIHENVAYILVEDTSFTLGFISSNFFDEPSTKLKVIGITGTNGKTTCATLAYQLFTSLGFTCGLISTVENIIGTEKFPATHTTPDAISLQQLLHQMVESKCEYVFMEVSSHAIHQHRIAGLHFAGACFTNITHEHLDYHSNFEEYIRVKKILFDGLDKSAFALTNLDDKRGAVMLQNTKARKKSYALKTMADYKGKIIENNLTGLVMSINQAEIFFRMIGEFNAYNLLCVYGIACELEMDKQLTLQILSTLQGAEGRFECIVSTNEKILGIVDYAHTPDALLNVLATINKLKNGNETLFTIIGCGGDRDKTKRPLMALVACEHSNRVIFTSDNPRSEDPQTIVSEMEAGVPVHQRKKFVSILDRKEAIKTACSIAESGDIILIAGKGHEKYQEIKGVKNPFDDKIIIHEMFELLEK